MQKLAYLSNSRDFSEQGDINENKYFKRVNELLEQGWKVESLTQNAIELDNDQLPPSRRETFAAFVLLEKADEKE